MTKLKDDELENTRIVKDGEVLRVPMTLMDGMRAEQRATMMLADQITRNVQPSPSSSQRTMPLSDAERDRREKLYDDKDKKLSDAWRDPPAIDPAQVAKASVSSPQIADIYAARDRKLEDAWRSA